MIIFRWPQASVARQDLRYFDSLGQGWFGWIVRGRYRRSEDFEYSSDQSVIVCMLKEEANVEDKRNFLDETQFSAQYSFFPSENSGLDIVTIEGCKNVVKFPLTIAIISSILWAIRKATSSRTSTSPPPSISKYSEKFNLK